jgi:formylglycine-generating enzyme required for sulfatase activity/GTPase Era involved in 16S rRNA processing
VVAFGGGFSAGKSSLINALLGRKLMVTEVAPTTSLPTYVLCGERDEVSALNLFGHRVALTEEAFLSLTHDEPLLYGSHISRLLRAAFMTRADFPWQQLALIDTPGYSKDQSNSPSGTHDERTDEHIARAQLNAAQAVVWVIDARQGCITEDDLAFLGSLQRSIPLFIALSRADQKPESDIPGILSVISAALKGRNIPVVGMAAFSARKTRAWPLEPLLQQLMQWNEQAAQPQLAHSFQAGFVRYDQFLAQQYTEAQDELNRLNRILALSDHREAQAEATHLKTRCQTRLQSLKEQGQQLEALWQTFGTQLTGLGQQVGMTLPVHGVLRKAVSPVPQPPKAAPAVTVAKRDPQPGDILCAGSGFPELVLLPGGSFQMGDTQDSDEQPVHTVHIASFAMGKYPVTQGQWKKVMGRNPSYFSNGGDQCPVETVSWEDAQMFIQKLNQQTGHTYRLPSEAEWEYACRAGSIGQWCFGDDESQLEHYAWYNNCESSRSRTYPVGEKKANAFGLYDMHGNVSEWCEDQWHNNYQGAPSDGRAWVDGWHSSRVNRGGSWYDRHPRYTRAARRNFSSSDKRDNEIGFRLARTVP